MYFLSIILMFAIFFNMWILNILSLVCKLCHKKKYFISVEIFLEFFLFMFIYTYKLKVYNMRSPFIFIDRFILLQTGNINSAEFFTRLSLTNFRKNTLHRFYRTFYKLQLWTEQGFLFVYKKLFIIFIAVVMSCMKLGLFSIWQAFSVSL